MYSNSKINEPKAIYNSKDGNITLTLQSDNTFLMSIKPITTIRGDYNYSNTLLKLRVKNTEIKSYILDKDTNFSNFNDDTTYRLAIRSEKNKVLRNLYCSIENNDKIIKEFYTNNSGEIRFSNQLKGTLKISLLGYIGAKINLDSIKFNSVIIKLQEERFNEGIEEYQFKIDNDSLVGLNEISDWMLYHKKV